MSAVNGMNIRYVQYNTPQGIGYGCYSIQWRREKDKLICNVGSSFCNPKDHFNKPLARKIADGRLIMRFQTTSIETKETGFLTTAEFNNILNQLFYTPIPFSVIPGWARRSFNKGKYAFGLKRSSLRSKAELKLWKKAFVEANKNIDFKVLTTKDLPSDPNMIYAK